TEMINRTKINIRQSSFHLLFWGWLIFACSLSEYLLWKFTDFASPWYVWFFVIPGVFVSIIYGYLKGRQEKVITYATMIYVWTWIAFLIASVILTVILWKTMWSFAPLILTMVAIPLFISGFVIKFKPLTAGAITFWVFALVAHFGTHDITALAVPAAMLTGYLIPGYMLKRKVGHDAV
ncbi:MAG: hypothetical protein JXB49_32785, partial [Bacteroidales bacterium]|nr:hypothetical protein [Bacteroidales bacterium]